MMKGRLEDDRMLTGRGRYVSDWNLPGQAYAHFVRSDRAHAAIRGIDASGALDMPGVLAVLTGDDVAAAGLKSLPAAVPVKGRGGADLLKPDRPALAQGRVRFVGEPVALVVAETTSAAEDAAEAVMVEYEDLPAVVRAEAALADGAPQLFDGVPRNCVFDYEAGDEKSAEAAFARAAKVVRLTVDNTRVVGNPMEPRACLAHYDEARDLHVLYACTQGVAGMRGQLATVLGVPPEKVRVVAEEVGGGFGVRFNIYPEYCAAVLAARQLKRPVKWTASRSEVFVSDEQARDVVSTGELALDASGRFLGIRLHFVANLGAYLCPTGPFINTVGIVNAMGVYDVPAMYSRAQLVVTNTAPMAAYRGAGRPVMSYVLERLVDQAAAELGLDPAELRRRNFIPRDKMPYRIASGYEYDSGDFSGCLERALKEADWQGFGKRRADSAHRGRLRGRGLSTYIEATGAGFAPVDQVELRFSEDGTLTLLAPTHNHGQGHETTYAQIVTQVLGVPLESVRLRTGNPDDFILGNATGGSRSLLAVGSVMQLAAREVVEKGRQLAADELEAAVQDIVFEEGRYRIEGTDRAISMEALARKHPQKLTTRYENKFGATFPNGCHVAEVEIDPETGESEIVSYVACDDAGHVVNHQIVEGQIMGGLTQGAGQVFQELAVYDEDTGQLLTGSFMDYAMPRAVLVNGLKIVEHPVPTKLNPLGAKGVGEAGVTGSLPALANAVMDALRSAGVKAFDMPASPLRVWNALQSARP